MANNIVKFPGEWKGELPPPNYNELMEERQQNLETYCVEQGVNLSYDLFYELQQLGWHVYKVFNDTGLLICKSENDAKNSIWSSSINITDFT